MRYLQKLEEIEGKYDALTAQLGDARTLADPSLYHKTAKAHADLREVAEKFRNWKDLEKNLAETKALLEDSSSDAGLKALAQEEIEQLQKQIAAIEEDLRVLLLPRDPNDEKNVVLEIRAGTGGDEATLFAQEMFRMYSRYAESQGWRMEALSTSVSGVGGLKEVIALIEGQKVYSKLKYESGVHRVQRVPATEQSGRIHTSAITIAVLPEADEVEIEIDPKDIRIDTFCSSGPGGQSVNTTYSAVRITHLPTGTVVSCQDEKSQIKNRAKALRVLRSRLYELKLEEQRKQITEERRSMVGSGDRSEKIRTYNFPQNRVTDHRIGLTLHQLDRVMDGRLDEIIEALVTTYQAEKLKGSAPRAHRHSTSPMSLREALRQGLKTLLDADIPSPELAAELLLMHVLGCDRGFLHSHPGTGIPSETAAKYFRLIEERLTGKPTQYITGHQEFWGLDFEVTPDVLIPRPETECLVEAVLGLVRPASDTRYGAGVPTGVLDCSGGVSPPVLTFQYPRRSQTPPGQTPSSAAIVDVGTGSGCIALALASELPGATLDAVDISPAALRVAGRNAQRLGRAARVRFCESDLLSVFLEEQPRRAFDVIVSNPPYVGLDELDKVQREVREFEPRLAWGGLGQAEEVYRRLFPQALELLKPGGHVAVEIGYQLQDRVITLLRDSWLDIEVRPDLSGLPRVVTARKPA